MGKIVIGIHPDQQQKAQYTDKSYTPRWVEFLAKRDVEVRILNLLAPDALEQARQCDGIMWLWTHHPSEKQSARIILSTIENYLRIPVFPDEKTSWHYDEKVAQFYLLRALNTPIIKSWVFWDQMKAVEWSRQAKYPIVFKMSSGAGSANVLKVENVDQAQVLIGRMFQTGFFPHTINEHVPSINLKKGVREFISILRRVKYALKYIFQIQYPPLISKTWWKPEFGYVYFQEFVPDNAYDTRVTVIGNRAFAFRRFNRPNDFRASGSGRLDYDISQIDLRCVQTAFEVSKKGQFQSMAYDFLIKDGQPVIGEISYTYWDKAVYDCPGHWLPDLTWVDGHQWPEEAQIDDFLEYVRQKRND